MKTKASIIGLILFTGLILAAGLVVIHHKPLPARAGSERVFQAKGLVRSLQPEARTVLIEHEEIPDFMPAMTMPFTVRDPALLRDLKPGDPVTFELVVTKGDSWISHIKTIGKSREALLNSSTPSAVPSESQELAAGSCVPDFTLTNQDGQPVHLRDFKGKAVLLTFVYTRCPLPNYCPLMSKNFASLQERLNKQFAGRFQLLTISFDPEHDSPEVLKQYAQLFTHDENTWSFATGTASEIRRVATEFGLVYLPESGTFTHDLRTALIAPDGRLVHIWRSNVWTPYEVQRWVGEILGASPGSSTQVSSARDPRADAQTQQIRD